jgi:hypothetical protein
VEGRSRLIDALRTGFQQSIQQFGVRSDSSNQLRFAIAMTVTRQTAESGLKSRDIRLRHCQTAHRAAPDLIANGYGHDERVGLQTD